MNLEVDGHKTIFVCCGDWDMETMLPSQFHLSNEQYPDWTKSWLNVKSEFERLTSTYIKRSDNDLVQMMEYFQVDFEGRLHSGKDDVKNIYKLLRKMCEKYVLDATVLHPSFGMDGIMPWINENSKRRKMHQEEHMEEEASKILHEMDPNVKANLDSLNGKSFEQEFDLVFVLDFEATCLKEMKIDPQEIIEIPVIVFDLRERKIVTQFHCYVKPLFRPRLSPFCVKLTGISQTLVDVSDDFQTVFMRFTAWLDEDAFKDKKWTFLTVGDWDLKTALPTQCELSNVIDWQRPEFDCWIDIKKEFVRLTGCEVKRDSESSTGLEQMLNMLGLRHEGHLHSGIDDVKNTVKIVDMLTRFGSLQLTSKRVTH